MRWESAIPQVLAGNAPRAASEPMDGACGSMNSEAFAGFYERSARSLWAYLARVSGDPALADDLMQESYVRFLCAAHPEDGEVAARRYLFRIATNLLRDHWRKQHTTPIEDIPEERFATADNADHSDSQMMLGPALAQLRPRESSTLVARICRGLHPPRNCGSDWPHVRQYSPAALSCAAQGSPSSAPPASPGGVAMTKLTCAREKEVEELVRRGQWPHACAEDLRAHVEGCRACSDLALVAQAFQAAHASAITTPALPSADALWWRAQLRRRNAAVERIGRPILGAQIFAFGMILLVAAGALAGQMRRGFELRAWIEALPRALHLDALWPTSLSSFDGSFWYLVPVLATLALVGGVVVYFASEKQ